MKKLTSLFLIFTIFFSCSSSSNTDESQFNENAEEISYKKGLGMSTTEYVANWNKLVENISEDSDTILYFSINPDEVRWVSPLQEVLYYQFGKTENTLVSYAINLVVQKDIVTSVEFTSPVIKDDTASQRTKLFFLLLIAMADDSLDKDGREKVLTNLGLYDQAASPEQIGGSLTLNGVQYIIEPLVDKGFLIAINFYTELVNN